MATINSTSFGLLQTPSGAPAPAVAVPSYSTSGSSVSGFGDAFSLNLSATTINAANPSSNNTPTTPPSGGAPPAGASPRSSVAVASTTTTSTDLTALIQEAKAKAAIKIGYADASNVVDSQGNIETAKLQKVEAQQAAKTEEQKQVLNRVTQATQGVNLVA